MNKITINGIELEITDEQAAELVAQYKAKQSDFPTQGQSYYALGPDGEIGQSVYYKGRGCQEWDKSIGNCFRTREEAEHYRDCLVALNTLKKSSDFAPDWGDSDQRKYFIEHCNNEEFTIYNWIKINDAVPVYYRTYEDAEAALEKYLREFEIVYGIAK